MRWPEDAVAMEAGVVAWVASFIPSTFTVIWANQGRAPSPPKPFVRLNFLGAPRLDGIGIEKSATGSGFGFLIEENGHPISYAATIDGVPFAYSPSSIQTVAQIQTIIAEELDATAVGSNTVLIDDAANDIVITSGSWRKVSIVDLSGSSDVDLQVEIVSEDRTEALVVASTLSSSFRAVSEDLKATGWKTGTPGIITRVDEILDGLWIPRAVFDIPLRCVVAQKMINDYVDTINISGTVNSVGISLVVNDG